MYLQRTLSELRVVVQTWNFNMKAYFMLFFFSTLPKIFLYKVHIFFWCKMVISRHLNFLHINFSHHCSPNYNQTTQRATFYSPLQLQVNKLERRMFLLAFILILQNNTIFRRIFSFKKKIKLWPCALIAALD